MKAQDSLNHFSWSNMKEVLEQLHDGYSRHLGVEETKDKARQQQYWLYARNDMEVE
jgi:2-oxoglutarate dehydrogenase complex dehydrogenase (E1) component-like enzyme